VVSTFALPDCVEFSPRRREPVHSLAVVEAARDARVRAVAREHLPSLWRVLRRCGVEAAEVEDVAQEVLWVFARRAADVEPGRERAFLIGTAVNMARDRRRHYARRPLQAAEEPSAPEREQPDHAVARADARRLLGELLQSLPEPQREVFVLVELEELTLPEVASALELPLGTATSRLRTARLAFEAAAERFRARTRRGPP
jgi:RNA polymerase sigma-70 factor (ECF subfamily)